jgi:hypothetical protein
MYIGDYSKQGQYLHFPATPMTKVYFWAHYEVIQIFIV